MTDNVELPEGVEAGARVTLCGHDYERGWWGRWWLKAGPKFVRLIVPEDGGQEPLLHEALTRIAAAEARVRELEARHESVRLAVCKYLHRLTEWVGGDTRNVALGWTDPNSTDFAEEAHSLLDALAMRVEQRGDDLAFVDAARQAGEVDRG